MAGGLERQGQRYPVHDTEVIGSNPGLVQLRVTVISLSKKNPPPQKKQKKTNRYLPGNHHASHLKMSRS